METVIRVIFGVILSTFITIIVASGYNAMHDQWMIGADPVSLIAACAIFATCVAVGVITGAMITRSFRARTTMVSGACTGAVLFIANTLLHLNAGFTVKGLIVITILGAISSLGMLVAKRSA